MAQCGLALKWVREIEMKQPSSPALWWRVFAGLHLGRVASPGMAVATVCLLLAGCGTTAGGGLLDSALGAAGLQRPPQEVTDAVASAQRSNAQKTQRIALRLHAADRLNTDASGQSLSVVAKIYKLKDRQAFMQASDSVFLEGTSRRGTELSGDAIDVKEVVLTPGQRYEVMEDMPAGAAYLGVVVLFRAPAERRGRFVFDAKEAASTGITLGVHACAMSVAIGQPLDVPPEMTRLAGVQCK